MKLKFKLAQLNLSVGDFKYNFDKIKNIINRAQKDKTDILVFPELSITGYPPEDLLFNNSFIADNLKILKKITALCKDLICVIGFVNRKKHNLHNLTALYNSAAVIYNKKIHYIYNKTNLINYSVFDEKQYFKPGNKIPIIDLGGVRFGIYICKDLWADNASLFNHSQSGKTDFIICINASSYYINKYKDRIKLLKKTCMQTKNYMIYLNMVGAQDETVFDGNSLILDNKGQILKAGAQFKEDTIDFILQFKEKDIQINKNQLENNDYILINNFQYKKNTQRALARNKIKYLTN